MKNNKKDLNKNNCKKEIMRNSTKKSIRIGLGWGFLVFGIYLLLSYLNIVPFTSRLDFIFNKPTDILLISILLIVAGVLVNEKIRNIFRR